MADFPFERSTRPKTIPTDIGVSFGDFFSDHMFRMDYTEGRGWLRP
jgi:branched-chain amino acid aminotransferase